jgi:hypothetical protein
MESVYLKSSGISEFVIAKFGIMEYPGSGQVLYPYKQPDGTCQYVIVENYRNNLAKTDRRYFLPKREELIDGLYIPFGLQVYSQFDPISPFVVVEREINSMAMYEVSYAAIGINPMVLDPKKYLLPSVNEDVEVIYFLFKNPNNATRWAGEYKKKLTGPTKLCIVKYPDNMQAVDYTWKGRHDELRHMIFMAKYNMELTNKGEEPLISPYKVMVEGFDFEKIPKLPEGDFIESYKKYASSITDAPEIYHEMVGVVLLSTVIGNKITFGDIKPNIYAVLVGKSTIMRKSVSINCAMNILGKVNPNYIIPSDFSPEALGDRLSKNPRGLIYWSEFSQFLSIATGRSYMSGAKEIITDLFDCPKERTRILREETIVIKNPYINILTATTKAWMKIDRNDLVSGFLGRFTFVHAEQDEKDKRYILPRIYKGSLEEVLVSYLEEISNLEFEMQLSKESEREYEKFYVQYEEELSKLNDEKGESSFLGRLSIYVLKFAMVYQISEKPQPVIELNAMRRAIALAQRCKKDIMILLKDQLGSSKFELDKARVYSCIEKYSPIERTKLMRNTSGIPKDYLNKILEHLKEEGRIDKRTEQKSGKREKTIYWVIENQWEDE